MTGRTPDSRIGSTQGILACWMALVLSSCHPQGAYLKGSHTPLLRYERTMCFGPCPAFLLEVERNGAARFNGRSHVDHMGEHTAQWTQQDLKKLALVAEQTELDRKAGTYDNPMIMDLPAIRLFFGGYKVLDRVDGPDLSLLYAHLDSLIGATDWKPAEQGRPSGQR